MSDDNQIGLVELLNQVKQELLEASVLSSFKVQGSDGSQKQLDIPLFAYGNIELELQVTVKKQGGAGIKIYVFDLKGGGSRDDVQKIKVTLEPLFTKQELLDTLKQQNPKFFEHIKRNAPYASTKGNTNDNLDDNI